MVIENFKKIVYNSRMIKDMSTGHPLKLLILFTIPVALGSLFQQFYSMIDTVIVGRFVGVEALAALGAVGGLFFFVVGFASGLGNGLAVIVAQEFGAKNYKNIKISYAMSIILSTVISIFLSIIFCIFSIPLLKLMKTPDNIITMANSYIFVIYVFIIAFTFFNYFSSVLRAFGDSKSPVFFLVLATVINIILDLVFVLIIPLGCFGVALATVIAQSLAALALFIYLNKKMEFLILTKEDFVLNNRMIVKLLKIGLPAALQYSVCSIGVIFVQIAVNSFGSDIIAAFSIGTKIEAIYVIPLPALGVAISTYAGQNLGAGKKDRIQKGFISGMIIVVVYSLMCLLVNEFATPYLASIFIDSSISSPLVLEHSLYYINVAIMFFIPLGTIFVYRTGDQGLGSGAIPLLSSFVELLARGFASFILPYFFGVMGLYYTGPTAWISAAIILPICHYRLKKKLKF